MQIGEFARICNTKISVLRHYDKEGLLLPDYIDRFTGYRYYAKEQIAVFFRISALKKAGFSLSEIKDLLAADISNEEIIALFEKKKAELSEKLNNLNEAKKIIFGIENPITIGFVESENSIKVKSSKIDANDFNKACDAIEKAIATQGYQRISGFCSYGTKISNEIEVVCDVIKLSATQHFPRENIDLRFEDDPSIVGRWEAVGEFTLKEDFFAGRKGGSWFKNNNIYFLPEGKRYWCYGWTKGKLTLIMDGTSTVNNYTTEIYDNKRYMFVDLKSYYYRHGGRTTVLVLRQLDNKKYSPEDIARKDNIDMPFINDERVIGKWKAVNFCVKKDRFDPAKNTDFTMFFADIEFMPDGEVVSRYNFGAKTISGRNMQEWTNGYVLCKFDNTACAYEFAIIDDIEYLLIEWKNGDYIWGGYDCGYYVFVRAKENEQ